MLEQYFSMINQIAWLYIGVSIFVWLMMAGICAWLAGQKGRDKVTWSCLGLLIGIFALILLAVSPSKKGDSIDHPK